MRSFVNINYIEAQLFLFAPFMYRTGQNGIMNIVLRSERGKTNHINIDAQCADEIEMALRAMAERIVMFQITEDVCAR